MNELLITFGILGVVAFSFGFFHELTYQLWSTHIRHWFSKGR